MTSGTAPHDAPAPGGPETDRPGRRAGDIYIGLDLGTSGLKAVALTTSGEILARGGAAYPTHRPGAGACEQDTGDWQRAVERAIAQLGEVIPARRWRAIGLSGMIPTLVTLGPDGIPNGPAISWQDSRADDLGEEFRGRYGAAELYQLTGQ
jgi:xylulokinase